MICWSLLVSIQGSKIVGIEFVEMIILGGLEVWIGCLIATEYKRSKWLALKLRVLLFVLTRPKNWVERLVRITIVHLLLIVCELREQPGHAFN